MPKIVIETKGADLRIGDRVWFDGQWETVTDLNGYASERMYLVWMLLGSNRFEKDVNE